MFSVFVKLGWFFKEEWKRYAIAIPLLILAGIFDVIPPRLVGMAIDQIHIGSMSLSDIIKYIVTFFVITVISYGITYIWMHQLFGSAYLVERKLRSRLMNHFLKMTPVFFEKNKTGDLMARATNDLKAISITAGFGILTLVDSIFFMLTILFMMCVFISFKLTLMAIIPLPIMALLLKIYGDKLHNRFTNAQKSFGELNDRVLESISGIRVIRAYAQERADEKRFFNMTEDVYKKNVEVAKIDSLFEPTINILVGMCYVISLGYGSYLVFNQEITLGDLVAFNVYLGMLIWPMFAIGELMNVLQKGNASLDRVQQTLDEKEQTPDMDHPKTLNTIQSIKFDNVTFQYPSSNVENLKRIYLELKEGETLGIVGRTGSGKTTLIKQLLREYPIKSGEIYLSGIPINQISKIDIRERIGYVPQEHILFSKSIKENILFGNPNATEEELMKAIEIAAFDQDLKMLPEGLETLVGEKGVALSGGQKQRISIARAIIKNPELLILDDSLSAVDAKTEQRIIENIRKERKGKITIISTHRMSAVQNAHWIIVLNDGEIVEEGTHEMLMKRNGWYKEQFELNDASMEGVK